VHAPGPAFHWQPRCDAQDDAESIWLHGVIVPPHESPAPAIQLHCGWSAQVVEPRSSHGVTVPLQIPVHVQPCVWQVGSSRDAQGEGVPTHVMSCVQRQPSCASHVVTSGREAHGTALPVHVPPLPPSSVAHVQPAATQSVSRSSVALVYVEQG
jgi:hypothetical protein